MHFNTSLLVNFGKLIVISFSGFFVIVVATKRMGWMCVYGCAQSVPKMPYMWTERNVYVFDIYNFELVCVILLSNWQHTIVQCMILVIYFYDVICE